MLESNDPDAIPTLDEESLDPKEMELLEHWARNSPQMAMQYKSGGRVRPPRDDGASTHLHNIQAEGGRGSRAEPAPEPPGDRELVRRRDVEVAFAPVGTAASCGDPDARAVLAQLPAVARCG